MNFIICSSFKFEIVLRLTSENLRSFSCQDLLLNGANVVQWLRCVRTLLHSGSTGLLVLINYSLSLSEKRPVLGSDKATRTPIVSNENVRR